MQRKRNAVQIQSLQVIFLLLQQFGINHKRITIDYNKQFYVLIKCNVYIIRIYY